MEKSKIAEAQELIEKLRTEQGNEIRKARESLTAAKELLHNANDAMTEAYAKADVKTYHKAQDDIRSAQDAISMYEAKLTELNKMPLISKAEYEDIVSGIYAELKDVSLQAKKEFIEYVDNMQPVADEVRKAIEKGNRVLLTLQTEIYKDERLLTAGSSQEYLKKQFKDYTAVNFATKLLTNYFIVDSRKELEANAD